MGNLPLPVVQSNLSSVNRRHPKSMFVPMPAEEKATLESLDRIVHSSQVQAALQPVVNRVRQQLVTNPESVMGWEPVPLAVFDNQLPPGICSGWVFILRAGVNTGPERHPNSHQRMMSYIGKGDMQLREAS